MLIVAYHGEYIEMYSSLHSAPTHNVYIILVIP